MEQILQTKPLLRAIRDGRDRKLFFGILVSQRLAHFDTCGVSYRRCNTCRKSDENAEILNEVAKKFFVAYKIKDAYETTATRINAMKEFIRRRQDL